MLEIFSVSTFQEIEVINTLKFLVCINNIVFQIFCHGHLMAEAFAGRMLHNFSAVYIFRKVSALENSRFKIWEYLLSQHCRKIYNLKSFYQSFLFLLLTTSTASLISCTYNLINSVSSFKRSWSWPFQCSIIQFFSWRAGFYRSQKRHWPTTLRVKM